LQARAIVESVEVARHRQQDLFTDFLQEQVVVPLLLARHLEVLPAQPAGPSHGEGAHHRQQQFGLQRM